jgi:hypothetical protein
MEDLMTNLDAVREDVEIEMASEFARCRGDVYAEKEALWLALRDERVTKRCTIGDDREVFHVVAKRLGWSIERYEDGTYMSVSADDGWQLWQAALEIARNSFTRDRPSWSATNP